MPAPIRLTLAAIAALVLVAGPALAGGFGIDIAADRDRYVADGQGVVALKVTVRLDGCVPVALLAPDPRQAGPAIGIERREGDAWVVVESPWAVAAATCKGGESCTCHGRCPCGASCVGAGGKPSCSCDPDWAKPVRIERECEIAFGRRARLAPGTYRLTIAASSDQIDQGKPIRFVSGPFQVAGGGKA